MKLGQLRMGQSCAIKPRKGSVWLSRMTSIFHNLALENWLLRHQDLGSEEILLIWRDNPCVVIGRHQNPWQEANETFLQRHGIQLARRYSGGGAVYHDHLNVNFSFLTTKKRHCRLRNLEFLASIAKRQWKIPLELNQRHDLVLSGIYKVTSIKLMFFLIIIFFSAGIRNCCKACWRLSLSSLDAVARSRQSTNLRFSQSFVSRSISSNAIHLGAARRSFMPF